MGTRPKHAQVIESEDGLHAEMGAGGQGALVTTPVAYRVTPTDFRPRGRTLTSSFTVSGTSVGRSRRGS